MTSAAAAPVNSVAAQVKDRALTALDQINAELLKATNQRARVAFIVSKLTVLRKRLVDDELCEADAELLTHFFDAWLTNTGKAPGFARVIIDRGSIFGGSVVGVIRRIVEIPRDACVGAPMNIKQVSDVKSQANIDLQAQLVIGPPGCGQR